LLGAYASTHPSGAPTILINRSWFAAASEDQRLKLLLQEIGHAIDDRINGPGIDSHGDEGAYFARMLTAPNAESIDPTVFNYNDHYTINLEGFPIQVEASTGVVNPGFEATTALQGWTAIGTAGVASAPLSGWPAEGNYYAYVTSENSVAGVNSIESSLGLPQGKLNLVFDNPASSSFGVTGGSIIYQTVSASAGSTINFDWSFATNDYTPYNDAAFFSVSKIDTSGVAVSSEIFKLSDVVTLNKTSNYLYTTPRSTFNYKFAESGSFRLGFGAINEGDAIVSSTLYLDNLKYSTSAPAIAINLPPKQTSQPASFARVASASATSIPVSALIQGFTDPDGNALQVTGFSVSPGSFYAMYNAGGSGQITSYTVNAPTNYTGNISINYNVSDGQGGVLAASNVITTLANVAPVATASNPSTSLLEAGGASNAIVGLDSASITITKSDSDGTASYDTTYLNNKSWSTSNGDSYIKSGTYGTATFTLSTGVVSYSLNNSATATQSLTSYQSVSDNFGSIQITDGSATALTSELIFSITGSNDAPTVSATNPSAMLVEAGGTNNGTAGVSAASITLSKADVDGASNPVPVIDLGGLGKLIAPVKVEGKTYYHLDRNGDGTISGDTYNRNGGTFQLSEIYNSFKQDINGALGSLTNETYRYATINGVRLALPTLGTSPVSRLMDGSAISDPSITNLVYDDLSAVWDSYNGSLVGSYVGQGLNGANRGSGNVTSGAPLTWVNDTYVSATPWPLSSDYASLRLYDGLVLSHDNWAMNVALEVLSPTLYDTSYLTSQGWTSSGNGDYTKSGIYGNATLSLNSDVVSYSLNNAASATEGLAAGQSATDSFGSIQVSDGSATTLSAPISFVITGTNDNPTLTVGAASATLVEAGGSSNGQPGTSTATISISAADVDGDALSFTLPSEWIQTSQANTFSRSGIYGTASLNTSTGVVTYSLNNASPLTQALQPGMSASDAFGTVVVNDGHGATATSAPISFTISGSNDGPWVSGELLVATAKELGINGDRSTQASVDAVGAAGSLWASGVYDPEGDPMALQVASADVRTQTGIYGALTVNANGSYRYVVNNSNATVNALREDESLDDVFTITLLDTSSGLTTSRALRIRINGTDDRPRSTGTLLDTSVDEAGLGSGSNSLQPADAAFANLQDPEGDGFTSTVTAARTADGSFAPVPLNSASGSGLVLVGNYGNLTIGADGSYTYTLNNSNPAVNALREDQSLDDSFVLALTTTQTGAKDVIEQPLLIRIDGSNDAPISGSVISAGPAIEAGVVNGSNTALAGFNLTGAAGSLFTTLGDPEGDSFTVTGGRHSSQSSTSAPIAMANGLKVELYEGTNFNTLRTTRTEASINFGDVYDTTYGGNGDTFSIRATGQIQAYQTGTNSFKVGSDDGVRVWINTALVVDSWRDRGTSYDNFSFVGTQGSWYDIKIEYYENGGGAALILRNSNDSLVTALRSVQSNAIAGTYGTLTLDPSGSYLYSLNQTANNVQSLQAGDSLAESFYVTVGDGQGGSVEQQLNLSISGSNDQPQITTAIADPTFTELTNATSQTLTASGTLAFNDVDAGDTANVAVSLKTPATWNGGTLNASLKAALEAGFTLTTATAGLSSPGTVGWAYNASNLNLDFLGQGQSITLTYTVSLTDPLGGIGSDDVTITINGSNDGPVVTNGAGALVGAVTEAGHLDDGTVVPGIPTSSGTLSASDLDSGATRTWSIAGTPSSTYGSIAINASSGVWTYTLDNNLAATQALAEGQSVSQSYVARVTDNNGATADQTVSITINGSNDKPSIVDPNSSSTATFTSTSEGWSNGKLITSSQWGSFLGPYGVGESSSKVFSGTSPIQAISFDWFRLDTWDSELFKIKANGIEIYSASFNVNTFPTANTSGSSGGFTWTLAPKEYGNYANAGWQDQRFVFTLTPPVNTSSLTLELTSTLNQAANDEAWGIDNVTITRLSTAVFEGSVVEAGVASDGSTLPGTPSASGLPAVVDLDSGATATWSVLPGGPTTYGNLSINASTGAWTYTLDNALPATQALAAGATVSQAYTVRVTDDKGATADQAVTITITGSNDIPVISTAPGGALGTVREAGHFDDGSADDGTTSVSGTLSVADPDTGASQVWSLVGPSPTSYGSFTLNSATGAWSYTLNNSLPATQALAEGQSVSQSFTARATDNNGASVDQTVTITINGGNDSPSISTTTPAVLTSVGSSAYSGGATDSSAGNVYIQEVPSGNTGTVSQWKFYKPISASGLWVTPVIYEKIADNNFVVRGIGRSRSADGPAGVNTFDFDLVEGSAVFANGNYTYGHIDKNLNGTTASTGTASTGSISWGATTGTWGFINTQNPVSTLGASQSLGYRRERQYASELILSSGGGAAGNLGTVIEAGNNDDSSVLAGTNSVSGTLTSTDVDAGATRTWSIAGSPSTAYGSIVIDASTGVWSFSLDNSKPATQALAEGQSVTETFMARVTDDKGGIADQAITITINGSNDIPVISTAPGGALGTVREAGHLDDGSVDAGTASISGTLTASDVDSGASRSWLIVGTPSTTYGSIAIDASTGVWTYTLDNTLATTQALAEGQSVSQTYTARVTDEFGATADQTVTVTINGSNDRPVISYAAGHTAGALTEDHSTITTASGTLSSSDVDAGATATWSISAPTGTTPTGTGTTPTGTGGTTPTGTGTYGNLSLNGNSGQWTYTLNNNAASTQELAQGQTATDTFVVRVSDDKGAFSEQAVTITLTGSNDGPSISLGQGDSAAATVGELQAASGTLRVSDVDRIDAVTAEVVVVPAVAKSGTTSGLALSDAALLAMFSVNPAAPAAVLNSTEVSDQLGWAFNPGSGNPFAYLAPGETLQLTYTVRATDPYGVTADQAVTVTVTGANATPVITINDVIGAVTEDVTSGSHARLRDSGSLSFADVDLSDRLSASSAYISASAAGGASISSALSTALQDLANTFTLSGAGVGSYSSANTGTVNWDFSLDNSLSQYLAAGESVTVVYRITISDDNAVSTPSSGNAISSYSQDVSITITGSNDAPTISAGTSGSSGSANLILPDSSLINTSTLTGVAIVNAGDGTSYTGGFNIGKHIKFGLSGESNIRWVELKPVDTSGATNATFSAIKGNGNNGGKEPDHGEDLLLQYKSGNSWVDVGFIIREDDSSFDVLKQVSLSLPVAARTSATTFRLYQPSASGSIFDHYGIAKIEFDAAAGAVSAGLASAALTEANSTLSASGNLAVGDVDLTNTVTAAKAGVVAGGVTSGLPSTNEQLLAMFAISPTAVISNTQTSGTLDWTFNSGSQAFNYLATGEQLTLTYTVRVTDSSGATADQPVTLTITGSNDPVLTSGTLLITTPNELGSSVAGGGQAAVIATGGAGSLFANNSDLDSSNVVQITQVSGASGSQGVFGSTTIAGLYGSLQISANGAYSYTVNDSLAAVNALREDQSLDDSFSFTVSDGQGSSVTQAFTLRIDGSNDGPLTTGPIVNAAPIYRSFEISDTWKQLIVEQNHHPSIPGRNASEFQNEGAFAALRADGSVITWGNAYYGGVSSAVATALSADVSQIFSSSLAFAAVRDDGSVVTWGAAEYGGESAAVATSLNAGVTTVASTTGAFAALKADGSVVTWGGIGYGGDSSAVASQLNGSGGIRVQKLFSSTAAFAALRSDGSVVVWGDAAKGGALPAGTVSTALNGSVDVVSIRSSNAAFAALRSDGTVVTWGDAAYGGNSSGVDFNGASNALTVSSLQASQRAFAAVLSDGSVVTWGSAEFGGDSSAVAAQLNGSTDVVSISTTGSAFAALRADGSLVTWGHPDRGGLLSAAASASLSTAGAPAVVKIVASGSAFAALRADGSVVSWGSSGGDSSAVAGDIDGVPNSEDIVDIAATSFAFAALRADGSVVTWGDASRGGNSGAVDFNGANNNLRITRLGSNFYAFSALRSDGSVVVWGDPDHGGNAVPTAIPGRPVISFASALSDEWYRIEAPDVWAVEQGIKADGSALAGQAAERIAGSLFVNASDPEGQLNPTGYRVSAARRDGLSIGSNAGVSSGSNAATGALITGTYGSLRLGADGSYRYAIDNANAAVNALAAGSRSLVDRFVVTLTDQDGLSGEQVLEVQILGSDDGPTSSGQILNAGVREAGLTATGASEPGANASGAAGALFANLYDPEGNVINLQVVNTGTLSGSYGSLSLAADGSYTYTVNQANTSVNALAAGETLDDVFTINVVDQRGFTGSQQLRLRINGSNDAPILTVASGNSNSASRSETNGSLSASGSFSVSDVDLTNTVSAAVVGVSTAGPTAGLPTGLNANAILLDGNGDFVEVADSAAVDLVNNYTLEAWINPSGTGSGGAQGGIIFNKENSYEIARFGDGSIQFALMPAWFWVDTGLKAPLNTWSHIALSHNGSTVKVYLNGGTAAGGSEVTLSTTATALSTTNYPLRIGSRPTTNQDFLGKIADVRVWNLVRSAEQIAASRSSTVDPTTAGLVANYRFDGTGSTVANAASGPQAAGSGTLYGQASRTASESISADGGSFNGHLLNMLNVTPAAVISNSQTSGTLNWNFGSDSQNFDYLAAGEQLTLTYTVRVTDSSGATADQPVTLTINGSNDTTVITVNDVIGAVTEDQGTTADNPNTTAIEAAAYLIDSGAISFADVDATDLSSASIALKTTSASAGASVSAELASALAGAMQLSGATNAANNGNINWRFALDNNLAQYLAAGETVTSTYTITVSDDSGTSSAATSQDVTVIITGSNDAPRLYTGSGDKVQLISATSTPTFRLSIPAEGVVAGSQVRLRYLGQAQTPQSITSTDISNGYVDVVLGRNLENASGSLEGVPVKWIDWTNANTGTNTVTGAFVTEAGTVQASLSSTIGWAFVQTNGGTNFFNPTAPYTSTGVAAPGSSDIIAFNPAGWRTLSFDQEVQNLYFAFVSMNGNGYRFDRDFDIVSQTTSATPGYWGSGNAVKNTVQIGGKTFYELQWTAGEPHGVIRFKGAFSSLTWENPVSENWHGFTVGIKSSSNALQGVSGEFINPSTGAVITATPTLLVSYDPTATGPSTLDTTASQARFTDGTQPLSATGSLTVFDADRSNQITALASSVNVSGVSTGIGLDDNALLGLLAISSADTATSQLAKLNWQFTASAQTFDYLAAGEEVVLTYNIGASDGQSGSAAATSQVTLRITGINELPQLSLVGADSSSAALSETNALLSASGTLTAVDSDRSNSVSATVRSVAIAAGSSFSGSNPFSLAQLQAMLSLGTAAAGTITLAADAGSTGNLSWRFQAPSASSFDFLASGETLVLDYTLRISDGFDLNSFIEQPLRITLTGSNDRPVITAGQVSGAISEDAASLLTSSGAISFTDADGTDLSSATVVLKAAPVASPGAAVNPGLASALAGAMSLSGAIAAAHHGTVLWTFAVNNALVQDLAAGETVTATYTITITDDSGTATAASSQDVTVVLTGSNDLPQISTPIADQSFGEALDASQQTLSASGLFSFNDVDATNVVAVASALTGPATWSGGVLDPGLKAALEAGLVIGGSNLEAPGSIPWSYNVTGLNLDFLAAGESISLSYTVTLTDSSLAAVADVVTITILGSNDRPLLNPAQSGPVLVSNPRLPGDVPLAPALELTDHDRNLVAATVTIEDAASGDILNWTLPSGASGLTVTSTWVAAASGAPARRVLSIAGNATPELYGQLLRSITYTSSSTTPWRRDPAVVASSRTDVQLTWTVDDGFATPVSATSSLRFINLKPEIASGTGHQLGSTDPLPIDSLLRVSDPDTTQLASARVQIENPQIGDLLQWDQALALARGLTVAYATTTAELSISGVAAVEDYQALLRSVTYAVDWTRTATPSAGALRSIAVVVVDANDDTRGQATSEIHRTTIRLAAIASGPAAGLRASAVAQEDNGLVTTTGPLSQLPALPLFTPATSTLTLNGKLAVSDADFGQNGFSGLVLDWSPQAGVGAGGDSAVANLGQLTITPDGSWTYTVDNTHPTIQALRAGEQRLESFLVQSKDGTARQRIDITIEGRDDLLAQYASRVLGVSSQGKDSASDVYKRWYANQALGAPNSDFGDLDTAWSPRKKNSTVSNGSIPDEIIELGFSRSVVATGARIYETAGLGFIREVSGVFVNEQGQKTYTDLPLWSGIDNAATNQNRPGVLELSFGTNTQLINGLSILVDIDHSSFWEQIDAVELIGLATPATYLPQKPTIDEIADDNQINLAEKAEGVMLSGSYDHHSTTHVDVRWGGRTFTTQLNPEQGLWWVTVPAADIPADAAVSTLTVQAFDRSDLRSGDRFASAVVTATVAIDTVAPARPTLATVTGDDAINQVEKYGTGVTLSGTAEPLSQVEVAWDYKQPRTVQADSNGAWSLSFLATQIPMDERDSHIVVTAIDAADNRSVPLDRPVIIDTDGPLKATINPLHWNNTVNASQKAAGVQVSGSAEPGAAVAVGWLKADGSRVSHTTTADRSGVYGVAAAAATVTLLFGDTVLGTASSGETGEYLYLFSAANLAHIQQNASNPSLLLRASWSENGATRETTALRRVTGLWQVAFSAQEIPADGQATRIDVVATDALGNVSQVKSDTVLIDTQAPDAPVLGELDTRLNAQDLLDTLLVKGAAELGGSVVLRLLGETSVARASSGRWTAQFSPAQLARIRAAVPTAGGSATLTVQAFDSLGNGSGLLSQAIAIDALLPDSPTFTRAAGSFVSAVDRLAGFSLGGSAEPLSSVELTWGPTSRTVVADSTGAWSVRFVPAEIPADTAKSVLQAVSVDAVGNRSKAAELQLVIDSVAPRPEILSIGGPDGTLSLNSADQQVSGLAEASRSVALWLSGGSRLEPQLLAETVANAQGVFALMLSSLQLAAIGEGKGHLLELRQSDAAGNAAVSTRVAFAVDTKAPELTITSIGGADGTVSSALGDAEIKGQAEPGLPLQLSVNGPAGLRPLGMLTPDLTGLFSFTLSAADLAALGQGSGFSLALTQADAAGNSSSLSRSFSIDTQAPAAPQILPAGGKDATISTAAGDNLISGQAQAGAVVTVELLDVQGSSRQLGQVVADALSGTFKLSLTEAQVLALPQGRGLSLQARISDAAGNAAVSSPVSVDIDTLAPAAPVLLGVGGADATLTSAVDDNSLLGSTIPYSDLDVFADVDGLTVALGSTSSDGKGLFKLTLLADKLAQLGQGLRQFWAVVRDAAGNQSRSPALTAMVDTVAEQVPLNLSLGGADAVVSSLEGDRTIRGLAVAGRAVTLEARVPARGTIPGFSRSLATVMPAADGSFQYTLSSRDLQELGEGSGVQLVASQLDPVGNVGRSVPLLFSIDTTAPEIPQISSVGGDDGVITNVLNSGAPDAQVRGIAPAGAAVSIWGRGDATGFQLLATVVASADGTFAHTLTSAQLSGFQQGSGNQLQVRVSDDAGNTSSSYPFSFSLETQPPASPSLNGLNGGALTFDAVAHALGGLLFSGRAIGAAAVELQLAGIPQKPLALPNSDGDWSVWLSNKQLATFVAGSNVSISLTALGPHGDRSAATTATLRVDFKAPAVTNVIQEGQFLRIVLDEAVVLPATFQSSSFSVRAGTRSIPVQGVLSQTTSSGRTELIVQLGEVLSTASVIKLGYVGGGIVDALGNALPAFSNRVVTHVVSSDSIGASSALPVYSYETFELSGNAPSLIFGNDYDNQLVGNQSDNLLIGGRGADSITGGLGRDTYVFVALSDSLLFDPLTRRPAVDRLKDLAIGTDIIDGPSAIPASAMLHINTPSMIPTADLFEALLPPATLPAFGGSVITTGSGSLMRTFVVLNDANPGYQADSDSLIEITGYTGLIHDLRII